MVLTRKNSNPSTSESGSVLSRGDVQALVLAPRSWPRYSKKHLPPIAESSSIADLAVTARSANCIDALIRGRAISRLAELPNLTVGELMRRPNFGIKSLADVLRAIGPIICEAGLPSDTAKQLSLSLTRAARRLATSPFSRAIRCDDPRMRGLLGELLYWANNISSEEPLDLTAPLQAVAHRMVIRIRDPVRPSEVEELICRILSDVAQCTRMTLEDELRTVTSRARSRPE